MKTKRSITWLAVILLILTSACESGNRKYDYDKTFATADEIVADAQTRITEIDVTQFKQIFDSQAFVLVDVRSEKEHQGGFIPGAVNIPRGSLEFRVLKESIWAKEEMYVPEKDQLIVVFCKAGNRSALAAETLQRMGFTNVISLKGGWNAWKESFPELFETDLPAGAEHAVVEEGGC